MESKIDPIEGIKDKYFPKMNYEGSYNLHEITVMNLEIALHNGDLFTKADIDRKELEAGIKATRLLISAPTGFKYLTARIVLNELEAKLKEITK